MPGRRSMEWICVCALRKRCRVADEPEKLAFGNSSAGRALGRVELLRSGGEGAGICAYSTTRSRRAGCRSCCPNRDLVVEPGRCCNISGSSCTNDSKPTRVRRQRSRVRATASTSSTARTRWWSTRICSPLFTSDPKKFNSAKCTTALLLPKRVSRLVGNSGNVCGAPHTHIHSMLLLPASSIVVE